MLNLDFTHNRLREGATDQQINDKAFLERSEKKIPILLQIPDAWARMPVRRFVWV